MTTVEREYTDKERAEIIDELTADVAPKTSEARSYVALCLNGKTWELVGKVEAVSSEQAVRKTVQEREQEATFVAVPSRSWQPVTVSVKTTTSVVVEPSV